MGEMREWPALPPSMGELLARPHDIQAAQHELDCRLEFQFSAYAYERARAEAAMARLYVAVHFLHQIQHEDARARDLLRAIGPLPPLPPQPAGE